MDAYYPMIKDALGMFLFLGLELSILFLLISAGVSLLQQYIPDSKIQALLSGGHGRGYILAALLGSVTPFCSCSTIPMLRGLLKAKVGFGPTLTFLFTSPLLNPIIVGLFLVTFGFKVTVVYVLIGLGVSLLAGLMLDRMGFEKYVIPEHEAPITSSCCSSSSLAPKNTEKQSCCDSSSLSEGPKVTIPLASGNACCASEAPKPVVSQPVEAACCSPKPIIPMVSCCGPVADAGSSCCAPQPSIPLFGGSSSPVNEADSCCDSGSSSCCDSGPKDIGRNFSQKIRIAFQDGWRQFKAVLPYLLVGVSLGALIYGFVPSDFIAAHASGDSLLAVPIAAVIGIPLYVRAEALIPLSAVLVSKGMGLGAVMALIIGGSGASLTEVILLKSMFRTQMVAAFLVVILGMAIFAGYLFQFII
ncbi:permease [Deltaproteobacteria bacterium OttesenSCG-928-M10]|nr:permease [Deltaproteobacteria bacterium OttesenSCG-928-M10]